MDHVHESGSWRRRRWRWAMPLSIRDERVADGWPVAVAMTSKAPTRNTASGTNYPHPRAAGNPRAQPTCLQALDCSPGSTGPAGVFARARMTQGVNGARLLREKAVGSHDVTRRDPAR